MMLHYPNGKGTLLKLFLQLAWRSPRFHVLQTWRNLWNRNFWQYGFKKHSEVKRKNLGFWRWWSLNRDMENDAECPGWQWWYYEVRAAYWGARWVQHGMQFTQPVGMHQLILRNYRKHPLTRSAIEKQFYDAEYQKMRDLHFPHDDATVDEDE